MIDEIFAGLDPVIPLPLMTPAQKDNELERIFEGMESHRGFCKLCDTEVEVLNVHEQGKFKRTLDTEFDRGFKAGLAAGIDTLWEETSAIREGCDCNMCQKRGWYSDET